MTVGQWRSSTRRARLPTDWPARRRRILIRDQHRCQLDYPGICAERATDVDHIIAGDNHDDHNLQAACDPCHQHKSSREGVHARADRAAQRLRPPRRHPGRRSDP